jgi:predicted ATPase/DNA-binding SARP family transcriptional activator
VIEVRLLGPVTIDSDGQSLDLRRPLELALMARLALSAGRMFPAEGLVDDLWGDSGHTDPAGSLHNLVYRLRRSLGSSGGLVQRQGGGYALAVSPDHVDSSRFDTLVEDARHGAGLHGPRRRRALLQEALGLWRGTPLAGLEAVPFVTAQRARLEENYLAVLEERLDADLACGAHHEVVSELEGLVAVHQFRERLWSQLVTALYRSGSQTAALRACAKLRELLVEHLGLEPSPMMRSLEDAVLRQDTALDWPEARATDPSSAREEGLAVPHRAGLLTGSREHDSVPGQQPQRRHNLPHQLSSFVGREAEMAMLTQLLPGHRLITLVGAGGVGKTRLALQMAAAVVRESLDGVWLAELAALRKPALVAHQVAEAIGILEQPGRPMAETLVDALNGRRLLVVLDNCEHLMDAVAGLAETLLHRCPGLQMVATSREPLGVEGEHIYRLLPLGVPVPERETVDLEDVYKCDAVQLFVDRAAAQRPDFCLDRTNAAAVAAVCQRLDGIPLAIELAAARLRSMSIFDIESNLADRFALLTGGRRTALPRHRALQASIDWSYEMLSSTEQTVLRRLSQFTGGCRLDAAQQVCANGTVGPAEVPGLLGALVDRSLVEAEPNGRTTRYRLLETIREYAAGRPAKTGAAVDAARVHAQVYLDLAERAAPRLRGHDQVEWAARIDEDVDNIRAAGATFLAGQVGAEGALRLAAAQCWYWGMRARYREGADFAEAALQHAGELRPTVLWTRALLSLLWMKGPTGDLQSEQQRIDEGLVIARAHDDRAIVSDLLSIKVFASVSCGQVGPDVVALALESTDLARKAGDPHLLARVLSIAPVVFAADDITRARSSVEEAVSLFRAAGDQHWLGLALNNLADVAMYAGDLTRARAHLEDAIAIVSMSIGESSLLSGLFVNSGTAAIMQEQPRAAEAFFREAFALSGRVGGRFPEAASVLGLAWCASAAGDWHRAASLHGLAQGLVQQLSLEWQPLEARITGDDRHRLGEAMGVDAYLLAFNSGVQLAESWWQTDRNTRAAAIF